MSIYQKIFGQKQPAPQQQQPGQQPQQVQQVQPSQQPGGLNNAANAVVNGAPPGSTGSMAAVDVGIPKNLDKATLDDFNKLWDAPAAPADGKQRSDPGKFTRPKLDMNKMGDVIGKMSFTGNLDPGLAQKALGGDMEAFMQVLDSVGRNAFQSAFSANETYQGRLLEHYDSTVNARIPKMVGSLGSQQKLGELNPQFQHPALAPMVDSVRRQFETRYPDASPAQIAEAVNAYMQQAAKVLTPSQGDGNSNNAGNFQSGNNGGANGALVVTDFEGFETDPASGGMQVAGGFR